MRKQTKLVAVLSAAALLAIGASMTSFAAAGWAEEDGVWVYLDKDGDRVTDTWKKSGNKYFYLNEDGEMATETLIDGDGDHKFYVDVNGAKVVNSWISVENEDNDEIGGNEVDTIWYYFGSTGKAHKDAVKTINGKQYIFDTEGHMLSGWQTFGEDVDIYYLGDENEGWAATGWQSLEPSDSDTAAYDDEEWFYFKPSNGKAYKDARKYINGKYYTFDENGIMEDKWLIGTPGAASASPASAYYTAGEGYQGTGWVYTYAKEDPDEEDVQYWYYLNSKGGAFNSDGTEAGTGIATATKKDNERWKTPISDVAAKVIKSKTYLFDGTGKMQTGVFKLEGVACAGKLDVMNGYYYFNTGDGSVNGQMATGKTTVNYDGDNYYYYFQKNGSAYTNRIVDSTYYGPQGARVNADDGNTYQVIVVPTEGIWTKAPATATTPADIDGGEKIIVSSTGKVKKNGTVKIDGIKYTVANYIVTAQANVD